MVGEIGSSEWMTGRAPLAYEEMLAAVKLHLCLSGACLHHKDAWPSPSGKGVAKIIEHEWKKTPKPAGTRGSTME